MGLLVLRTLLGPLAMSLAPLPAQGSYSRCHLGAQPSETARLTGRLEPRGYTRPPTHTTSHFCGLIALGRERANGADSPRGPQGVVTPAVWEHSEACLDELGPAGRSCTRVLLSTTWNQQATLVCAAASLVVDSLVREKSPKSGLLCCTTKASLLASRAVVGARVKIGTMPTPVVIGESRNRATLSRRAASAVACSHRWCLV